MLLHKLCDAVARHPIEHCLPVVILLQERFHAPAHIVAVAALGEFSEELLEVLGVGEREQAGIPLLLALLLLQYLQIIIAAGACCTEQQKQENDARDAPSTAFLLGLRAIGLCAWSVWGNGRRSIGHGFLHGLQWGGAVGANRSRFHHIFVAVGTLPDISAYRYTAMWACSSQ